MSKKSPNQATNSTSSFDMVIQNTPVVSLVLLMSISLTADVYSSVAKWRFDFGGKVEITPSTTNLIYQCQAQSFSPSQKALYKSSVQAAVACYAPPRALKWEYPLIWCAPMQSWPDRCKQFGCVCLVGYHQSLLVFVCLDSGARHQWGFGGGLQASGNLVDLYPSKNTGLKL